MSLRIVDKLMPLVEQHDMQHAVVHVPSNSVPLYHVEHLIHEFSHAATFGLQPGKHLSSRIADRFMRIQDAQGGKASDLAECAGLAAEKLVLEKLHLPIDWPLILSSAQREMHVFDSSSAVACEVQRQLSLKVTKRRSERVLSWLASSLKD